MLSLTPIAQTHLRVITVFISRAKLILWHRWFGVLAALWLALMGVTGSIIVFYTPLDTLLNADLRTTQNAGVIAPVNQWVAAAEKSKPGGIAYFVDLPNQAKQTAAVSLAFPGTEKSRVVVFVDPYTVQVLGVRELGVISLSRRHLMNMIYSLHMDLLLGDWMFWFLGLIAFFWLIDHLLVLFISFPKAKQWWRSFLLRANTKGVKRHYDLHRAFGLWLFPVTLMLSVSGLYFNWNSQFQTVVNKVSAISPRHIFTMQEQPEPLYQPQTSFGAAVEIAQQQANRDIDIISYYPRLHAYMARAFDSRDVDSHARRLITIGAKSSEVLADQHAAAGSAGDVFMLWQYPLHSGKAFGWTGRIIIFVSGLALAVVCVTGVLIWWRKLKARKAIGRSGKLSSGVT